MGISPAAFEGLLQDGAAPYPEILRRDPRGTQEQQWQYQQPVFAEGFPVEGERDQSQELYAG